jgi:hypothetical protein
LKRIGATSLSKVGDGPPAEIVIPTDPNVNTLAAQAINLNFLSPAIVKTEILSRNWLRSRNL